jgi:predicted lipoprotein with Yx(FWY)xxD motif
MNIMRSGSRHRLLNRSAGMATAAAALLLASACGGGGYGSDNAASSSSSSQKPVAAAGQSVTTAKTKYGTVLADRFGKTLYAFAADKKGHSNCDPTCLSYWPLVPAKSGALKAPSGASAKLGTLTRADGASQLTVNGWPMYTYVGDGKPGQATGQGKNLSGGLWWVVSKDGSWIKKTSGTGGRSY